MRGYNNGSSNNNNNYNYSRSSYDDGPRGRGGGGGGSGPGQNRYRGGRPAPPSDSDHLPQEMGIICSLKDSFGFIYCADRPEEVFFHFSELARGYAADALRVDTEVAFRIGPSSRGGGRGGGGGGGGDTARLVAHQVRPLEPGTVVWETEDEPGRTYRGIVARSARAAERGGGPALEGTIHLLVPEEQPDGQVVDAPTGPEILFRFNDFQPSETENDTATKLNVGGFARSSVARRPPAPRLYPGDLVEFTTVTERRTKLRYARGIRLVLSERERVRQEQERRLLADATEEVGVVTALKGDYGFLLSNKRREEIYFHYSTIDMEESEHAVGDGDLVLKEGQEMKFLVVTEGGDSTVGDGSGAPGRRRLSARRVSLKPKGSVKFHDAVACGVTGIVVQCPQPVDAGHSLEARGKVLLHEPIKDKDSDGNERVITEVYLSTKDSPGGTYAFRGGSSVATWVQLGDTLLFDVVSDYVDGACHAAPTKHLIPNPTPFELEEEGDSEHPIDRRVRLISLSLMARSEGIVHTLKEAYGFIHYAERPVDVHFKLYQVLPDELQCDLRRNMGFAHVDDKGRPLRLEAGASVTFDISVHGRIHGSTPGRHHKNQQVQDRENLKAQRVLVLPPGSIQQSKTLGTRLKGKVSKKDQTQLYAGMIELETEVEPMSLEERHPLVAKMVESFLASPVQTALVFHDILSMKEDDVVINMIEHKAHGKLAYTHIPEPSEPSYPGKLSIRKLSAEECGDADAAPEIEAAVEASDDEGPGSTPDAALKRRKKARVKAVKKISSVRFDRGSLGEELKCDAPLAVDDVVEVDVVQSRRTGMVNIENMRVVERLTPVTEPANTNATGMGVVKEVVPTRNFGFIILYDESASKRETLFFQLSSVISKSDDNGTPQLIHKGDEVSFRIVTEKNGKLVARDVAVLPRGTIPSQEDRNACRGLVLLEPCHVLPKKHIVRHMSSVHSASSEKSSRWSSIDDGPKDAVQGPDNSLGCILLVEDAANLFGRASEAELEPVHVKYRNGSIAIRGSGSAVDTSDPRRGDFVSFVKAKNTKDGVRDIRIVTRGAATMVRGRLEDIKMIDAAAEGTAKFIAATDGEQAYEIKLSEVLGCDPSALKEKEPVEGVLHGGRIYGICRTCDVHLESKFGSNNKERPKLNLTVKKDRGGKIMAQSHMAKGPDGSLGFASGWTLRESKFGATSGSLGEETPPEVITPLAAELAPEI